MIKQTNKKIADKKIGNGFLSGVFILSVSTVIVKVIGLACKIPLISLLGAEGMGYFNSALEIHALLCVISTAGLPVALSMLVSACRERNDGVGIRKIWRTAFALFLLLGGVGALILSCFAPAISKGVGNPDAAASVAAIAPSLLFVCFASAVRGYFQGFGHMTPTAISQLIEALGKLIFGVLFAYFALDSGTSLPLAAAYSVFGITLGTALSALYLLISKARNRRYNIEVSKPQILPRKEQKTVSTLLKIAFPITVSSAVLSVTRMIDMSLILRRLSDIGVSSSRANEIFGSYTTLALPVFSLVPSLITPIALSLVPQLSAAIEKRSSDGQGRVLSDSMRLTVLFAIPSSMGIALYARPILSILFSGQYEAIDIAAPLLSILGGSVLFSCVITTTNAILQSYRKTVLPIISMAVGSAVKIVSAYILIGIEDIGVYGAPISTFLCNVCITAMNLYFISGVFKGDGILKIWGRPFVASLGGILLSLAAYIPLTSLLGSETLGFMIVLPIALIGYFAFAVLTRAITKDDLLLLPFVKNKSNNK
ncbi:MAG: polysaccharide biosynthesis protein [Ruminococcaceae bacterium]|nr:polysaccharide biosynthesis protein [Oscillospiraceae bacterium]